jgi:hypothetical protein
MIKKYFIALLSLTALSALLPLFLTVDASAASLRITPLMYQEKLAEGEVKKGYVDISNPAGTKVTVEVTVQAFKQIDNEGSLQFFESEQIKEGIKTDLTEFELGPREAVRMYFSVDGKKLPSGDVFGAIFASTKQSGDSRGITPAAQVGTLVILENGTPGSRKAAITSADIPTFHFGESVSGSVNVKNMADPNTASGFFPQVNLNLGPAFGQTKAVQGPLIFAGIERGVNFSLAENKIGLYKLTVSVGESKAEKWIVVVTGWWRWAIVGLVVLAAVGLAIAYKKRRNHAHYRRFHGTKGRG